MGKRRKKKHYDAYFSRQSHITAKTKTGALRQAKQRVRIRKS